MKKKLTKIKYESYLKKYFDVTTNDVLIRLLYSLIPFNPKFYDISTNSPDLYGPFWIYTCLIFIIAASGSLSRYFQGSELINFFENFVPIAALIIYGIGFFVPLIIIIIMKCFGCNNSYISVLCIYGYSFSIYIPVVIICGLGINFAQWILLLYAACSSTSFIIVNFWREMGKFVDKMRIIIIIVIICGQICLFSIMKFYFFEKFEEEVTNNNIIKTFNNTDNNTTNSTGSWF